jgi:glycogen debranching enzyme
MRGEAFAVFDSHGDLDPHGLTDQGLFYRESRHLSKAVLRLAEIPLILLSSTVRDDNALLFVDLTNSEIEPPRGEKLPRGTLHIQRTKFLWENACQESIEIHNYGLTSVSSELILEFAADFADIFEVRGYKRKNCGRVLEPQLGRSSVTLSYEGLDSLLRTTKLEFSGAVARVAADEMRIPLALTRKKNRFYYHSRLYIRRR